MGYPRPLLGSFGAPVARGHVSRYLFSEIEHQGKREVMEASLSCARFLQGGGEIGKQDDVKVKKKRSWPPKGG